MKTKHIYILRLTFICICITTFLFLFIFPKQSLEAARSGLLTWGNIVLPSLFPFFIATEIIIGLGLLNVISSLLRPVMSPLFKTPGCSSFVWVMSLTSGYPMGATLIARLLKEEDITVTHAQRMLAYCSTSGPLFMLGAVGAGMLGNVTAGKIIIISHYISSLLLGLMFRYYGKDIFTSSRFYKESLGKQFKKLYENPKNIGLLLKNSVTNSINTILLIGAFIIFFSVISSILVNIGLINFISNSLYSLTYGRLNQNITKSLLIGIIEITNGCKTIAVSNTSFTSKIVLSSFLIGWSGFSIHAQVISILNNSGIKSSIYILCKLIHGLLASLVSFIIIKASRDSIATAFAHNKVSINYNFNSVLHISLNLLLFSTITIITFSVIFYLVYRFIYRTTK